MNENKAYVFRGHTNPNCISRSKQSTSVNQKYDKQEKYLKSPSKPIGDFCLKGELDLDGSENTSNNQLSNEKVKAFSGLR